MQTPFSFQTHTMGVLGGLAGAFFATSIGGLHLLGLEGWRFAFHVVAGISIAAGLTVLAIGRDPRRKVGQSAAQLAFGHTVQLRQADDPLESSRQYHLSSDVLLWKAWCCQRATNRTASLLERTTL